MPIYKANQSIRAINYQNLHNLLTNLSNFTSMKSSLSHLPEKNQFEINHIVEIIREVVNPAMIILFGSYAKGKQVNHKYQNKDGTINEYISDYDFLVVVNKVTLETSDQEWHIEERAESFDPPVNLEIHEVDFVNYGLETGQYFFTDIVKEGIVLYDSGTVYFAKPRHLSTEEELEIFKQNYQKWFKQAQSFLKLANVAYQDSDYCMATFQLHQCAESLYYTMLLAFTGYKPKTHNLKRLRKKSKHLSEDLYLLFPVESNKHEKHLFELLKRGYIEARYSQSFTISKEEVTELLNKAEKMVEVVKHACAIKFKM